MVLESNAEGHGEKTPLFRVPVSVFLTLRDMGNGVSRVELCRVEAVSEASLPGYEPLSLPVRSGLLDVLRSALSVVAPYLVGCEPLGGFCRPVNEDVTELVLWLGCGEGR